MTTMTPLTPIELNNRKEDRDRAVNILSTIYSNVLKDPNNPKFRLIQ